MTLKVVNINIAYFTWFACSSLIKNKTLRTKLPIVSSDCAAANSSLPTALKRHYIHNKQNKHTQNYYSLELIRVDDSLQMEEIK